MSNEIQFLLYSLPDEDGKVQVIIKNETIWCTPEGYGTVVRHRQVQHKSPYKQYFQCRSIRGEVEDRVEFYNLDMIISNDYEYTTYN